MATAALIIAVMALGVAVASAALARRADDNARAAIDGNDRYERLNPTDRTPGLPTNLGEPESRVSKPRFMTGRRMQP